MTTNNWTLAEDLMANEFGDGVALNLFELYRARLQAGQGTISGVTFRNCRIEGPAVMLVVGECDFDGVNFGDSRGDIRNLVLHPASPTGVIGAIPVKDCKFLGAQFYGVGFTGGSQFLDQLLAIGSKS